MIKVQQFLLRSLCYICSFVMSFSIIGSIFFGLSSVTIGNENYLYSAFMNGTTTSSLQSDLNNRMKEIAKETGIPEDVFSKAVRADFIRSVQTTVVKSIYSGQNENFDKTSSVRMSYERALESYFEENDIKHKDKGVKKAVDMAVDAFNESCGIKNNSELAPYANFIRAYSIKLMLLFAAMVAVSAVMIYFLNGKRRKGFNYVGMSLMTAGEIMISIPAVTILCRILNKLNITNIAAYNKAINQAVNTIMLVLIISGVVLVSVGIIIFIANYKYYSYKFLKRETEYEIYKNLT